MSTIPSSFDDGPCLDEVFLLDVNQFMCELWSSPGLLKIPTTLFSFVFFPSFFQVFSLAVWDSGHRPPTTKKCL